MLVNEEMLERLRAEQLCSEGVESSSESERERQRTDEPRSILAASGINPAPGMKPQASISSSPAYRGAKKHHYPQTILPDHPPDHPHRPSSQTILPGLTPSFVFAQRCWGKHGVAHRPLNVC